MNINDYLPPLNGVSEKQIRYAEDVRKKRLQYLLQDPGVDLEPFRPVLEWVARVTEAKAWLDAPSLDAVLNKAAQYRLDVWESQLVYVIMRLGEDWDRYCTFEDPEKRMSYPEFVQQSLKDGRERMERRQRRAAEYEARRKK